MQANFLGSANPPTGKAALIIGSCVDEGMPSLMNDPKTLNDMFNVFNNLPVPSKFANAVALNCQIQQQVARVYDSPFVCSVITTVPLASEFVEARMRSSNQNSYEFNIMRTVDFIGRNYLMVRLPRIDCGEIKPNNATNTQFQNPRNAYLGAWHRDLVPRIIRSLSFYSRFNNNVLFDYSGYDIYIFNLLFGNSQKEMNDVMAGEDRFELSYDPYYVNGAALGLASFKGLDPFQGVENGPNGVVVSDVVNCLQIDDVMDSQDYREFYRRGVWFETPQTRNVGSRHSIHSRRMIHNAKTLWIPLDILPFGYSVNSAIPVGAIHGEVGYIHLDIYTDWLDRAFYVTRLSDIPSICPLLNHKHYAQGDAAPDGSTIGSIGQDIRIGWVNEMTAGRFADAEVNGLPATSEPKLGPEDARTTLNAFGSIIDGHVEARETNVNVSTAVALPHEGNNTFGAWGMKGGSTSMGDYANWKTKMQQVPKVNRKVDPNDVIETYILPLSKVSTSYYDHVKNLLSVRLIQVGYKTLSCIRDLINKLPNIFIATEWCDTEYIPTSRPHVEILNDLFIQALALWFIPEDSNGIESMRMYANHYIKHELPVINRIRESNENGQGVSYYTWDMLNMVVPSVLGLQFALPENIGIIPFSPKIRANSFPYSIYDTNVNGQLRIDILPFEGEEVQNCQQIFVNMKKGRLLIISIGINALCMANMNIFKCMA